LGPNGWPWPSNARKRLGAVRCPAAVAQHLRLANAWARDSHAHRDDVAQSLVEFAESRNVTKIVIGKTSQPRWKRFLLNTVVDAILDRSGDMMSTSFAANRRRRRRRARSRRQLAGLGQLSAGRTGHPRLRTDWLAEPRSASYRSNIVMVFLLGVAFVAVRYGRGPAIATAVANVLVFDFFFVHPICNSQLATRNTYLRLRSCFSLASSLVR